MSKIAVYKKMGIILIITVLLSFNFVNPVNQDIQNNNNSLNNNFVESERGQSSNNIQDKNEGEDYQIKQEVRPEEKGTAYTAITTTKGVGTNQEIRDDLAYTESHSLNLETTYASNTANDYIGDQYSVTDVGYYQDSVEYQIDSMTPITDFYEVEAHTDYTNAILRMDLFRLLAQGFEVKWDYANFTRAGVYLYKLGSGPSADNISISIVSEGSDGKPNMTDVLANTSLISINNLPGRIMSGSQIIRLPIYDLTDVMLPKGRYYVVVDLVETLGDTNNYAIWYMNSNSPNNYPSYRSVENTQGTVVWYSYQQSYNFNLEVELLPVNSTGHTLEITDPKTIELKDNDILINSTSETVQGNFVGMHKITSNTSITLTTNTHYNFYDLYSATSTFIASNSTFDSHSINWEITWSTNSIDTTYSLTSRTQTLVIQKDWSNTFSWLYNDSSDFSSSRIGNSYICNIGTNTSAGDWKITTTSPNHLYSLSLSEGGTITDRFFLGYWTTDQTNVYGYNGSQVDFTAVVSANVGSIYNETTGTTNVTLFDPSGNILPNKGDMSVINPNYIFNDVTSYSKTGLAFSSPGEITADITIDPSNGTDLPGFWTAVVYWTNGTEVGFYTQRIVVQSQTVFTAEWEAEPNSDVWTGGDIVRKSGDTIRINTTFYNISEPFFSGSGTPIPNARVSYSTTWGETNDLSDYSPIYNGSITVSAAIGIYTVSLVATGAFTENQTASFDVTVFYESNISPDYLTYSTNYTNDGIFKFDFQNVTGSTNMFPDDLTVRVNSTDLNPSDFSYINDGGKVKLTIDTVSANLDPGYWEVEVQAYKANFRKSYVEQNATQVFGLIITENPTSIIVDSADTDVYVYYNASIEFRYRDLNHSTDITSATNLVYTNITNVDISVTESLGVYHVELRNNNYTTSAIEIFLDISKLGYESKTAFSLAVITVHFNPTEAKVVDSPTECYIGYNESIEIYYNDTLHNSDIEGAIVTNVEVNATSPLSWWVEELGNGNYNITFLNTNASISALNITITITKNGYIVSQTWVVINRADIPTHYEFYTTPPDNVTYLETEIFKIFYWDDISTIKINNSRIMFSGNITSAALVAYISYSNGTYVITISTLTDFGNYELIVDISLDGYVDQSFSVNIVLLQRETTLNSTSGTNQEIYAIDTLNLFLEFKDEATNTEIEADTNQIVFAGGTGNETLTIGDYFESITYNGYTATLHSFTFDPDETTATGFVFVFNITLSKFGYYDSYIIINLTVNINPSAIQCVDDNITIDSSDQAQFTFFYVDTLANSNITGAFITVEQLNGSVSDIDSLTAYSSTPIYLVDIDPDDVNAVDKTFTFNVTIYKAGYENQSYIIYLRVVYNPTSISADETTVTIYADEIGEFVLYYIEDKTSSYIENALVTIEILNGSAYIEDYSTTGTSPYYIFINPFDSNSSDLTFEIRVTISKGGFAEQSITLYLSVEIHPTKIYASSVSETIYADETASFFVFYWDISNTSVEDANYSVVTTVGETNDVESITVVYNYALKSYIFTFDFNDLTVTNETFVFNVTMWRDGFVNQSLVLTVKIHDYIKFDLAITVDSDTIHLLSTITITVTLKEAIIQLLAEQYNKLAYSPMGENVTITLNLLDKDNNIIETSTFNITITDIQNGNYIGQFSYRIQNWKAKSLEIECKYIPGQTNLVSTTNLNQSFDVKFPLFSDLFFEYLYYMIAAITIIAIVAVTLAIYYGVVRPKKQKQHAKRKQYCDTVSNILQSVTSMKKILVVHKDTSSPVYELDLGSDMRVSSALVTGFLQAVSTMAKEITGREKDAVKKLDYGDFIVTSAGTENYITYIFSDRELSEDITLGLTEFVKYFEKRFSHVADNWIGSLDEFKSAEKVILRNLTEHLYIWTLYPLAVNPTMEKEAKKLGPMSQKLLKFVKDTKDVTIGIILQYFDKWPREETISLIFALVEDHYLLTKRI